MTQIERERADAAMKTLDAAEPRIRELENKLDNALRMHRECLDEISNIRQNLAHKDRMLEELGNINGKAVAEVEKLRKALESILAVDDWESTAKVAAMWEIAERALA